MIAVMEALISSALKFLQSAITFNHQYRNWTFYPDLFDLPYSDVKKLYGSSWTI